MISLQNIMDTLNRWSEGAGLRFCLILWKKGSHMDVSKIYVGAHPNDHGILKQVLKNSEAAVDNKSGTGLILPPGYKG